ncbi:MAG: HalOD1 output domain-containing protein [Haloferacaceae archaeon]
MTGESDPEGGQAVEYDPKRGTYHVQHDLSSREELSVTVVTTVAEVLDCDPADLDLNGVIHPDALNSIFSPRYDGSTRQGGTLSFDLGGCQVTVARNGEIVVDPDPDADSQ